MNRKSLSLVCYLVMAASFVSGCSRSNDKGISMPNVIRTDQSSHIKSEPDAEASNGKSVEIVLEGNSLEFADIGVKSSILDELGFKNHDRNTVVTDKMCEKITKLNIGGFISTLEDLVYLPNLTEFYVDNSDHQLNLKGINKASKLTKVSLINCKLSEVDRLAELTDLEYLDISTTSSWGTSIEDYSALSALTNLKYLNMSWNGYNAYNQFNLKDGSFINELINLEELNIYETGIENYSLEKLSNLKKLTISECDADDILEQLCTSGAIKSLEMLDIYADEFSENLAMSSDGIKNFLSKAENLISLKLCALYCEIESLEGLGNLKSLEKLYFDNERYHIPLSAYNELTKLSNLKELTLTCSPNVAEDAKNSDDYAFLGHITNLEFLSIEPYDGLKINSFSNLEFLHTLELKGSISFPDTVDISGIEEFKSLTKLRHMGVKFKSSAPLDDLDYITVEEVPFI